MEKESIMRILHMTRSRAARVLLVLVLLIVFLSVCIARLWHGSASTGQGSASTGQGSAPCQTGTGSGYLHSFHGQLVDASGCQVHLTGVNWFGFETSAFAPH